MIHLDTNFLILALRCGSRQDHALRDWLRDAESIGMSTVAWAEFLCGPESQHIWLAERIVNHRVSFDDHGVAVTAQLCNQSGRRRGSWADCMIAATAIRHKALLATENPADFRRFESMGLELIGWWSKLGSDPGFCTEDVGPPDRQR